MSCWLKSVNTSGKGYSQKRKFSDYYIFNNCAISKWLTILAHLIVCGVNDDHWQNTMLALEQTFISPDKFAVFQQRRLVILKLSILARS
jgi:hypothetical protein